MEYFPPAAPWASKEEYQTTRALAANLAPAKQIRKLRPPPVIPSVLFPQKKGLISKAAPTIEDVLGVSRYIPDDNRRYLSGGPAGWQASARNVQGDW